MNTARHCESAPRLSRMGTAAAPWAPAVPPISGYSPFPAIACRMFMSTISSQTVLWMMRLMIASVCMPPSLGCWPFFLSCVHRTVDALP